MKKLLFAPILLLCCPITLAQHLTDHKCFLEKPVYDIADKLGFPPGWVFIIVHEPLWEDNAKFYRIPKGVVIFSELRTKRTFIRASHFAPLNVGRLQKAIRHEWKHLQISTTRHTADKEIH